MTCPVLKSLGFLREELRCLPSESWELKSDKHFSPFSLNPLPSQMTSFFSSSSSFSQKSYRVFLSFRGEDTRHGFTAHLYNALRRRGINTFIDDANLKRGRVISPTLVQAIENSMFSIVVLWENYASSRRCLEELVKILECMKSGSLTVFPIFYKVDPSDVQKQKGSFGEAFVEHEKNSNEWVKTWREALTQVANLDGWDSRNRYAFFKG